MIAATVCGNLGKDAEVRAAGSSTVCSFSVASSTKVKGEDATTWVRCSMFGKRGESLAQYLTKGQQVAVSGGMTTREYDGKTYLELRVDDLKLMGGKPSGSGSAGGSRSATKPSASKTTGGGGHTDEAYGQDDSDLPF